MRKNSFAVGCIILMTANIITRFLGFFYRVYMSKAIGAGGMGLYQLIMPANFNKGKFTLTIIILYMLTGNRNTILK